MPLHKLATLLTPHDVAKDSLYFAVFTSPWAFLASLDKTLVLGLLNLLILAFFRWRSLRLKARELELRHSEEVVRLRARLDIYEPSRDGEAPTAVPQRDRQQVLPRPLRPGGAQGRR